MMTLLHLAATIAAQASAALAAHSTWQPYEVALTSSVPYPASHAWRGSYVQLNATFTKGEMSLETPGFWDGGKIWKLRFAAPESGVWHWTTFCSDTTNTGLHKQNGTFVVTDYKGNNPLFKHGFLRPNKSGRFLEHADGTPFYWMGDTHWSGFSTAEHWADSDNTDIDPGPAEHSMLKEMVDIRAAQGYSVWKGETFVVNGKQGGETGGIANAGGAAWGKGGMYGELRPEFWRAIDDIMQYINSKGMVVSFAFAGIGRGLTSREMVAPILDLARYTTARYSGYNNVWTTCQEYCAVKSGSWAVEAWGQIAASQYFLDPHNRSTSLHNCASNPIPEWRAAEWYGHNTNQQGHFTTKNVNHWLAQYNAVPPRVLIEDEANYELLKYADMTTNVPGWLTRQSAWQSQIAGAAGYTYGGQGIWWACFNRTYVNGNCGPNDRPGEPLNQSGYYTWDQCLKFPVGGHQLPLMARFFRALPWHTLFPNSSSIKWDSNAPNGTQQPYQKADVVGDYIVAYLPQANGNPKSAEGPPGTPPVGCRPRGAANGTGVGLFGGTATVNSAKAHKASWFNPRTGVTTIIAGLPRGTATWSIPRTRPGGDQQGWRDWVLLIEPSEVPVYDHQQNQSKSWIVNITAEGRIRPPPVENGCSFIATQEMTITALCRLPVPGSNNIETVSIFADDGATVVSSQVDALSTTSDKHGFVCSTPNTTSTLQVGMKYFLTLCDSCDSWRDDTGTTLQVIGGNAAQVQSFYGRPPNVSPGGGGHNHCYGPLNFYFV